MLYYIHPDHVFMISLLQERSGSASVPQIFFHGNHVGGNSDLQSLLQNKEQWTSFVEESNSAKNSQSLLLPEDGSKDIPDNGMYYFFLFMVYS